MSRKPLHPITIDYLIDECHEGIKANPRNIYKHIHEKKLRVLEVIKELYTKDEADLIANLLIYWRYPAMYEDLQQEIIQKLRLLKQQEVKR